MKFFVWGVCFFFVGLVVLGVAQEDEADVAISPKASRYHQLLLKRLDPGYLFDRFTNAWLESNTLDELEAFLVRGAEGGSAQRVVLAFFHKRQGNYVEALKAFRAAIVKDTKNPVIWYEKGMLEAQSLDFDTALSNLTRAGDLNPKRDLERKIEMARGTLMARNGDVAKALETWAALLGAFPQDEALHEDVIDLQIREGLYAEALTTLDSLIAATKDPYDVVVRRLQRGDLQERLGQREAALKTYADQLANVEHGGWLEREIFDQIERLYRREDDLQGLQAFYVQLSARHPKNIVLWQAKAKLLVELGEEDEAVAAYRELLVRTPGDRPIREGFIQMLREIGRPEDAVRQLQALRQQHTGDAELAWQLVDLTHEAGRSTERDAAFQIYLESAGKTEIAYTRVARWQEAHGLQEAAGQTLLACREVFPDSREAAGALAAYWQRQNRGGEALQIWQELADGAGAAELMRLARQMERYGKSAAALTLLQPRWQDFQDDRDFVRVLVGLASAAERFEEAQPWALQLVRLSNTPAELEGALDRVHAVCGISPYREEMLARLRESPQLSASESCFLVHLLEESGNRQAAEQVLDSLSGDAAAASLASHQRIALYRSRQDWAAAAAASETWFRLPEGRRASTAQRLVELYQRAGDLENALKWLPEWKKLAPGNARPWRLEVELLLGVGREDEAIDVLRQAARQFEDVSALSERLAQLHLNRGEVSEGVRLYQDLYDRAEKPEEKLKWMKILASAARQQGRTEDLLARFEQRREANPESVMPLLALAEVYRLRGQHEERRRALSEAVRLEPSNVDLLLELAEEELDEGSYERAKHYLREAVTSDTTMRSRRRLAQVYFDNGELEMGLREMRAALEGDAASADMVLNMAQEYAAAADWDPVVDLMEGQMDRFPEDYRLRFFRALALDELGLKDQAIEAFLNLLTVTVERPGVSQTNVDQAVPAWGSAAGGAEVLPPEIEILMQRFSGAVSAFQHRALLMNGWQRPIRNPSSLSFLLQSQFHLGIQNPKGLRFVSVPHSLGGLRGLAIAYLREVAGEESESMVRAIAGKGVSYAELLMLDPTKPWPKEVLERHKGDVHLEPVIEQQRRMLANLEGKPFQSGLKFEEVREKDPLRALTMVHTVEPPEKRVREALTLIKLISDPAAQALVATTLSDLVHLKDLDATLKRKLTEAVVDRVRQAQNPNGTKASTLSSKYRSHYSQMGYGGFQGFHIRIARTLFQSHEVEASLKVMDAGLMTPMGTVAGGFMSPGFNLRNRSSLIAPLKSKIRGQLGWKFTVMPESVMQRRAERAPEKIWTEAFVSRVIPEITSPVLRAQLLDLSGQKEAVLAELNRWRTAEKPDPELLVVAAGHAAVSDDFEQASDDLAKAAHFPLSRDARFEVDSGLVKCALEQGSDAKESWERGRKAALRLRQQTLNGSQRGELALILEELGLEQEAENLAARHLPSALSGGSTVTRSHLRIEDVVEDLMERGRTAQAVRLLANRVKAEVPNYLASIHVVREGRLLELMEARQLKDPVLKALDPGTAGSPNRLRRYAVALDWFGDEEATRSHYRAILEKQPRDHPVRARLAVITARSNPKEGASLLLEIPWQQVHGYMNRGANSILSSGGSLGERLQLVEMAVHYLQELRKREGQKVQAAWAWDMVVALQREMRESGRDGASLPALFDADASAGSLKSAAVRKAYTNRHRLHEALCRMLLDMPSMRRRAFGPLAALTPVEDAEADALVVVAKALMLEGDIEGRARSHSQGFMIPHRSDSGSFPTPESYLLKYAYERKQFALFTEDLLPELRQRGREAKAAELEVLLGLYSDDDAAFLPAAETMVRSQLSEASAADIEKTLSEILDGWEARKLEKSVQPLILEGLKHYVAQGGTDWHRVPDFLRRALAAEASGDYARREAFFEAVIETIVPTPAGEAQADPRLRQVVDVLLQTGRLKTSEAYALPAVVVLHRKGQLAGSAVFHRVGNALVDGQHRFDEARARVVLEGSPLLADFPDFDLLSDGEQTVAHQVGQRLGHPETSKRARAFLERFPRTAGRDFLMIYVARDQMVGVDQWCQRYGEKLLALPGSKQTSFAMYFRKETPPIPMEHAPLSPDSKKLITTMRNLAGEAALVSLDAYLKAEDVRPQEALNRISRELAGGVFTSLVRSEPDRAMEWFQRVTQLEEAVAETRPQRLNASRQINSTYSTRLIGEIMTPIPEHGLAGAAFMLKLFDIEESKPLATRGKMGVSSGALAALHRAVQSVLLRSSLRSEAGVQRFKEVTFDELVEGLQGVGHFEMLASTFFEYFQSARTNSGQELLTWLEDAAQQQKAPALATELAMAARFAESASLASSQSPRSEMTPEEAHYHRYIADSSRLNGLRLMVASFVVEKAAERVHPDILDITIDLLATQWKRRVNVQMSRVIPIVALFLKQDQDEAWKERGSGLASAWTRSVIAADGSRVMGSARAGVDHLAVLLELEQAVSGSEGASRVVRRFESTLKEDMNVVGKLVGLGEPALAAGHLRKHWTEMNLLHRGMGAFDDAVQQHLPAFLNVIQDEELRFFGEAILVTAQSAPGLSVEAAAEKRRRLMELAGRFELQAFKQPGLRERSMSLLLESPEARELLSGAVAERSGATSLLTILNERTHDKRQRATEMHVEFLKSQLEQGEDARFFEEWEAIDGNGTLDPQRKHEGYGALAQAYARSFQAYSATWVEGDQSAKRLIPLAKMMLGNEAQPIRPRRVRGAVANAPIANPKENFLSTGLLTFVYAGEMAALNSWYESMENESKQRAIGMSIAGGHRSLFTYLAGLKEDERRSVAVLEYFNLPLLRETLMAMPIPIFREAVDTRALKIEELVRAQPILSKAYANHSAVHHDMAQSFLKAGEIEIGLSMAEKAVAIARRVQAEGSSQRADGGARMIEMFQVTLVKAYRQGGRYGEALKLLQTLPEPMAGQHRPMIEWAQGLKSGDAVQDLKSMEPALAKDDRLAWARLAWLWEVMLEPGALSIEAKDHVVIQQLAYVSYFKAGNVPRARFFRDQVSAQDVGDENAAGMDLISKGAEWAYHDANANLGKAWRQMDYDDAKWDRGFAPMGYGDGDEKTVLGTETQKPRTVYFRKTIEIDAEALAQIKTLAVHVQRDDGVVGFINGVEAFRDNMPKGEIVFATLASRQLAGTDEAAYEAIDVAVGRMREGANTLAVEVHQGSPTSSDVSFDLSLVANGPAASKKGLDGLTMERVHAVLGDELAPALPETLKNLIVRGLEIDEAPNPTTTPSNFQLPPPEVLQRMPAELRQRLLRQAAEAQKQSR